jgi:hypothetical protein
MAANIQELRSAIGFKKQSALQTALVAADTWSLRQTSRNVGQANLIKEDDAQDLGKGDSWATQLFPSHQDATWAWEAYLTSENAAMVAAFGLGKVTKATAGDGFKYTCKPMDPIVDGIEMPSTTVVQTIRQGGTDVLDVALVGMICEEFGFSFKYGPGRANATMRSQWVGSGMYVSPSTITMPSLETEHRMNSTSATACTIRTVNYITQKSFISLDMTYKNNTRLDSAFYPGSGSQNEYALRGRMRRGDPTCTLNFVAEFADGSTELTDMLAGTEGTAQFTIPGAVIGLGPTTHKLDITFHRVVFKGAVIGDTEGLVSVAVECQVMKHNSNGVLTVEVTNEQDDIFTTAT